MTLRVARVWIINFMECRTRRPPVDPLLSGPRSDQDVQSIVNNDTNETGRRPDDDWMITKQAHRGKFPFGGKLSKVHPNLRPMQELDPRGC